MSNISNPCLTTKVSVYRIPGPGSVCLLVLYLYFPFHFYFPMFLQLPNAAGGTFATRKILLQFTNCISPTFGSFFQVSFWEPSSWYSRWPAISLAIHKRQPWVLHAHSVRWFMNWEILGYLRDGPLVVGISRERAMTRGQWGTAWI